MNLLKKFIPLFFLAFSTFLFAQGRTIIGTIKDVNTKEPIDGVSISVSGSNIGTISNDDGAFKITVPEENSKLRFYHLSYSDKNYEVTDNANVEILMTPREYLLDEVVINPKPSSELLNDIYKTSIEKLQKNHLLSTYCHEFVKADGKYVWFADGLVDYYIYLTGKTAPLFGKDLCMKQGRVSYFKDPNLGIDESALQSLAINDMRDWVIFAYFTGFCLSNDYTLKNDHDYRIETKTEANGNSIGVITITPKEGIQKELMYVMSITYDPKTKLILEADIKLSPERKKYNKIQETSNDTVILNEQDIKASFKIDGEKYVMTHYQIRLNTNLLDKGESGKHIDTPFEFLIDMTTLDYKEGDFKIKKYKKNSLFQNENKYTEEFWKNQNVKLLSDEEEKIIQNLNQQTNSQAKGATAE